MLPRSKRVWGWALYDWANSAFATVVLAGFYPIFFKNYWSVGFDVNTSTAILGYTNSLASLLIAVLGPILGAISDNGISRKRFLVGFAWLGAAATAGLYTVPEGGWPAAAALFCIGVIGFSGANTFYDAMLPGVSRGESVDRVSGLGFSLGYLGGGLLFLINVLMVQNPHWFGLENAASAVRFSFLTVAVWWGGFTVVTLLWVDEEGHSRVTRIGQAIVNGLRRFKKSIREVRQERNVAVFLLAYWLYIDGVDTIVRMAVDYGLSIGLKDTDLILALLLTQFIAFPSALFYSMLGEKWDVKKAIQLAIFVYAVVTLWAVKITEPWEFFALATVIGLVQGGVQALSRSLYTRLIPPDRAGEFFGFYNMLGKFAALIGPMLVGTVSVVVRHLTVSPETGAEAAAQAAQHASRWSISSLLVLFFLGALLLSKVEVPRQPRQS